MTDHLNGAQKKYLRGLAHKLKPVAFVGQKGITGAVVRAVNGALDDHELIKLKFVDFKEKDVKSAMAETIEQQTGCTLAGMIGHTAIFYRPQSDEKRRKIKIPG